MLLPAEISYVSIMLLSGPFPVHPSMKNVGITTMSRCFLSLLVANSLIFLIHSWSPINRDFQKHRNRVFKEADGSGKTASLNQLDFDQLKIIAHIDKSKVRWQTATRRRPIGHHIRLVALLWLCVTPSFSVTVYYLNPLPSTLCTVCKRIFSIPHPSHLGYMHVLENVG